MQREAANEVRNALQGRNQAFMPHIQLSALTESLINVTPQ